MSMALTKQVQSDPMKARRRGERAAVVALSAGMPCALAMLLGAAYLSNAALPPVPTPVENPLTQEKRVLGKILFWDEQMSTSNVVSCGTCHTPARGGTDTRQARHPGDDGVLNTPDDILASPGILLSSVGNDFTHDPLFTLRAQVTDRTSMPMINAAYAPDLFWDGRARSQFIDPQTGQVAINAGGALESQAVNPPMSTVEMAHAGYNWAEVAARLERVHPLALATNVPADVAAVLASRPSYPDLFRAAFGDGAITAKRIAFALATYQRTLIADQTDFDRFRAGDTTALTPAEQRGLGALTASNCTACHAGDLFTDNSFRNLGLRPNQEDIGRQAVTGLPQDLGRFKVPSLRNAALKRSFMHNGQFQQLQQVIGFYAGIAGAPPAPNRDPVLQTVRVPPGAGADIQAFLTGGLVDPRVANQTFPFDKPTLFTERPASQPTLVANGTAGSGGNVPVIIVQAPSMVGSSEYRIGLDNARGGAVARLGISTTPPSAGRIAAARFLTETVTSGSGPGVGAATAHWDLKPTDVAPGNVYYAQWFITDAAAAGGVAVSPVAQITMFCGGYGCPAPCTASDFNHDGFVDDADFVILAHNYDEFSVPPAAIAADLNNDGFVDDEDFTLFATAYDQFACPS